MLFVVRVFRALQNMLRATARDRVGSYRPHPCPPSRRQASGSGRGRHVKLVPVHVKTWATIHPGWPPGLRSHGGGKPGVFRGKLRFQLKHMMVDDTVEHREQVLGHVSACVADG